ncbi:MAG: BlaI/MecI/CopY family transcriptional regulator [Verrucomicrobiota bacterium]
MGESEKLSSRERQVMDVMYRHGEATAREVEEALPDLLANATVRTVLRILEEKGHLAHREEGRQFVYYPVRPKEQEAKSAMERMLGVFYDGSVSAAVSGLLELEDAQLSAQELEDLESMIRKARNKGKA